MSENCLVSRLQGTVSGANLHKFGYIDIVLSNKAFNKPTDGLVQLRITYVDIPSNETPTISIDIPFTVGGVDYEANAVAELSRTSTSLISYAYDDVPSGGAKCTLSHKYNIKAIYEANNKLPYILSVDDIKYLPRIEDVKNVLIEGGAVGDFDNPNLKQLGRFSNVSGKLSDYKCPQMVTYINLASCSFAVVLADVLPFVNITSMSWYASPNIVFSSSDLITLFTTLTKCNTVDFRNTGVQCDINALAAGLKTNGVVSRTISITLYQKQFVGEGSGTTSVTHTIVFDANGDYTIS